MAMKRVLYREVNVPASTTNQVIQTWGTTPASQHSLRVSVYVGKVAGTVDLNLQDSQDFGIWNDVKATTIGASTDKTVTFTPSSATISSTTHGFTNGQQIAFISSAANGLPPEILSGVPYVVANATLNSFEIHATLDPSNPPIIPSTAGSGTNTAALIREASITVQELASADQTVTPLRGAVRLRASTDSGESIQIVAIDSSF